MSTASYLSRFLEPLASAFTPEVARQLADVPHDAKVQEYVNELAPKANAGTLTPEEEADYKAIIDAADMIAILQLKARRYLKNQSA